MSFKHPELKEGEVLLSNIIPKMKELYIKALPTFIGSVRVGNIAYSENGEEIVKDRKPLFGKLKKI